MTSMSDAGRINFPDSPRSELERTIEELVERANAVLATQGRLRSLLRANRVVVEHLDLADVLKRIVEAALELVSARFGALGVIAPDGHLEQFIHVGMPDEQAKQIGHLPRGAGVLGAVVDRGANIRLEHIADDPRSAGFPEHHPQMDGFLGVPIRVRDEVFGNLYLTEPLSGPFTAEDEELISALAATAGIAIENARLFEDARRRQQWSAAVAEVTQALLGGEGVDPLDVITDRVAALVGADLVTVILPESDGELRVAVARGTDAELVAGRRYASSGTLAGQALDSGRAAASDGQAAGEGFDWQPGLGPTVAVPLSAAGATIGVLTLSRSTGGERFTDSDLEMAFDFAVQASVAMEVARGRADRQQLERAEDRGRIARDLHDHVIQRLFGAGLALQASAQVAAEPTRSAINEQIDAIDAAIGEIRTAVFALSRATSDHSDSARHRVLDVVAQATPSLPAAPKVTFTGPVDLLVVGEVLDDVTAVVRESLSNIARHANASACSVEVIATDELLTVRVSDNGTGLTSNARRSGIANLERRAIDRSGEYRIEAHEHGGTRVTWMVPIESETT